MKRIIPGCVTAAAVAALLTLGSGGASAQSSMSTPSGAPTSRSAAPAGGASNATPMKDPLASEDISQISGTSVAGSDGSKIGTISTVLMDPGSKKVDRLVVGEGGVLGIGAHRVALPVDSFRWDAQNHNFVIQKTADDLKAMPEWQQPQLAENPNGGSASTSPGAGTAPGISAGASVGAVTAPVAPSSGSGSNR